MITPEELHTEYAASLVELDETLRLQLLEHVWADDCELVLPEGRWHGRPAVNAHISNIHRSFRHATPVLPGPVDAHSGFMRFEWRMIDSAGEVVAAGVNVADLDADGRIRRLVLFRGVRPGQYL